MEGAGKLKAAVKPTKETKMIRMSTAAVCSSSPNVVKVPRWHVRNRTRIDDMLPSTITLTPNRKYGLRCGYLQARQIPQITRARVLEEKEGKYSPRREEPTEESDHGTVFNSFRRTSNRSTRN